MSEVERLARAVLLASFEGPHAPPWLLDEIEAGLGGVCLFATNIGSDPATDVAVTALVTALRAARGDVIVAIDEEGGDVTRLDQPTGGDLPGPAALGVVDDVDATRAVYRTIGARLHRLGIDCDFAPSADVNIAAENPVIGVRSFGADPRLVARHVAAAVAGLESAGVAACVKHYPGHGATTDDSHQALPVLDVDIDTLRGRELVPFHTDAAAVMTAHLVVPAVDVAPATRSAALLALLRDELGYRGVIVSDALDMAGVHGPGVGYRDVTPAMIGAAAVRALSAGCDLLCLGARQGPAVPTAVAAAIVAAVATGELAHERLTDAAARITAMPRGTPRHEPAGGAFDDIAARALRVRGELIAPAPGALVVDCRPEVSMANHDVAWGVGAEVAALDPTAIVLDATPLTPSAELVAAAAGRRLIVSVRGAPAHRWQLDLLGALAAARPDLTAVELGWPDDPVAGARLPGATTVTTFGASRASTRAVAALLLGAP